MIGARGTGADLVNISSEGTGRASSANELDWEVVPPVFVWPGSAKQPMLCVRARYALRRMDPTCRRPEMWTCIELYAGTGYSARSTDFWHRAKVVASHPLWNPPVEFQSSVEEIKLLFRQITSNVPSTMAAGCAIQCDRGANEVFRSCCRLKISCVFGALQRLMSSISFADLKATLVISDDLLLRSYLVFSM